MSTSIFRALRSKNLSLFFMGQGISLVGTWITTIASSWLVYRLTQSEFFLGLIAFCAQFPSALFGPLAGVYVDRWDKRKVLLWTQALSMLQSVALAAIVLLDIVNIETIILLNIVQALINAFDVSARQTFIYEIIDDKQDLPNAIALNAAMFHGSRLVGPAVAGVLVGLAGEGICFLIDAVSYAAVLLSLFLIVERNVRTATHHETWAKSMMEGLHYVKQTKAVILLLSSVALISLFGTPQMALLPVFARDIFKGGPELFGYLAASSGFGAFLGALFLASRPRGDATERIVAWMPACVGLALILFSLAQNAWFGAIALFAAGFTTVTMFAGTNSLLQMLVEDSKRARVMSLFTAFFFGFMPLGGLMAGTLAHTVGASTAVFCGGIISLGVGILLFPRISRIRNVSTTSLLS